MRITLQVLLVHLLKANQLQLNVDIFKPFLFVGLSVKIITHFPSLFFCENWPEVGLPLIQNSDEAWIDFQLCSQKCFTFFYLSCH